VRSLALLIGAGVAGALAFIVGWLLGWDERDNLERNTQERWHATTSAIDAGHDDPDWLAELPQYDPRLHAVASEVPST
jgi:hypothetical protein